jgi:ParB family chromosome partitioning protein
MSEEKNKKGIGRVLMSLFGDQTIEDGLKKNQETSYLSASISDLDQNPFQPRKYFDNKKIDELAQSIKKNGLIQPIAVRKGKNNKYEIIAGERRWVAAQKAGLHEVPVIVLDLNDNQSLEIAIIENIQREELNSIEEARGYDRLIKEFDYNYDRLSEFMGKSRSHIVNTLRLLNLPAEVIKLVDEGKLKAGQVRPLVGRHNAVELAHTILKEKLSSRSIENFVKNNKEKEKNKNSQKKLTDPNILLAQRKIEENIGLDTKIINRTNGSGKVVIGYNNLDQFDLLSKLLTKKK